MTAISIHAPLAGRDGCVFREVCLVSTISIHAPLAGRDLFGYADFTTPIIFQSTRPLRGATGAEAFASARRRYFNPRAPCGARPRVTISRLSCMPSFQSTRPLRGATGVVLEPLFRCFGDFNPRAPCGARLRGFMHLAQARRLFQSTRPLRGATIHSSPRHKLGRISIHAPLAGRDRTDPSHAVRVSNFNPRAPCGARLLKP